MNGGAFSKKDAEKDIIHKIFIERNRLVNLVDKSYTITQLKKMLKEASVYLNNQILIKKTYNLKTIIHYFAIRLLLLTKQKKHHISDIKEILKGAPEIYLRYLEYYIYDYTSKKHISFIDYLIYKKYI